MVKCERECLFFLKVGDECYSDGGAALNGLTLSEFIQSGRVKRSSLHELCHTFGAKDSYCFGKPSPTSKCSNENCTTCYTTNNEYEDQCIMANLHGEDVINTAYEDLLCDRCKQDVYNYIKE